MAKTDWSSVAAQYQSAYAKTGISPKVWCEQHGLNYQSARRYIKVSDAQTDEKIAQPSVRSAQNRAQLSKGNVRNLDETAHTMRNENKAKEGEEKGKRGRGGKSASSTQPSAGSGQNPSNNSGRHADGRFDKGNRESVGNAGNPHPPANIKPGMQLTKTHGGYATFLDADELFDQAEELRLRDELIFTRARVISVTKTLKALQHDLAEAQELTDRIALYDKILRAEQALDRNIQRIESIERTLSALRIDEVSGPKIEADTKRINAATRKLTAEADLLEKDGGADTTPVAEMTAELQELGTGGLMS
ncbi:terminase [Aeromonas veronii]|uniref:terminase n=1 Tax=Aeromonas veronii TaxID=654 RepID=UPI00330FA1E8|nr:terminase [Aeromonas veronii]